MTNQREPNDESSLLERFLSGGRIDPDDLGEPPLANKDDSFLDRDRIHVESNPSIDYTEEFATTIGLYALGEVSLGKAAERADITRWEIKGLLTEAGVEVRLGPQTIDDLKDEVETALDIE